jgi:DNA-binding response OmpR family regulator
MDDITYHLILVVEPNPIRSAQLTGRLVLAGFAVRTVGCAREALRCVSKEPPDLIILNERLPDGRGDSISQELRNVCQDWVVPMVILRPHRWIAELVHWSVCGVQAYLPNVCDPTDVLDAVETLLS